MKNYLIIASMALTLAACSNKEEEIPSQNERVPVQFSAYLGVTETRAVDQTWSSTDAIGIYMIKAGQAFNEANVSEGAANVRYIVDAAKTNGFKPDGTAIYYPMDNSEVDFYAYYPQGATAVTKQVDGSYTYAVNVANQSNQEALDFLYSNNVNEKSKTNKEVILDFKHRLCKLILTVEPGKGVATADLTKLGVKVKNQNTTATFDLTMGTLGNDAATAADITLFKQTGAYVYEAILLPTDATDRTFEFNLNNGSDAPFTWNMGGTLEAGSKYTYTVKLNRTGVEATGQITAWNPVNGGEVDAN